MGNSIKFYKEKIISYDEKLKKINNIIVKTSILRLVIVLSVLLTSYYFYKEEKIVYIVSSWIIHLIIFLFVAYYHNEKINKRNEYEIYIDINKAGLSRMDGTFKEKEDTGEEFLKNDHPFSSDLDVFGRSSLFQMINSTKTKFGRLKLGNILNLSELKEKDEIIKMQEAIKELGEKIDFRQKLEVKSTFKKSGILEIDELIKWSKEGKKIRTINKIIPYFFIVLTTICLILIALKIIPISYFILVCMINYLVVKLLTKDLRYIIMLFDKHKKDIESYANLLEIISCESFESSYLKELKDKLNNEKVSCTREMKSLKSLVEWLGDSSSNAYYLVLNVTLMLDSFILTNLENWRNKNGANLENWLRVMGEFEALSSIANLSFDFEEWTYPTISDEDIIEGEKIAHPLIGNRAIANNFNINSNDKAILITGSNMSGKSTFLRTLGLNLLLSYIGAPTSSKKFSCGRFNIYTCMRTKDNLEESISSFYAEILRIKILIQAAKSGEKVFFLLDEIFKGTNSKDRHEGAKVLIKQLVDNSATGLISTHDLELCDLDKINPWIKNYNFREHYLDGKIKFDYILRNGKSTTQNAIHLMKLAGIEFNDFSHKNDNE